VERDKVIQDLTAYRGEKKEEGKGWAESEPGKTGVKQGSR